jgi:predicted amidophosphoribosyltransferase
VKRDETMAADDSGTETRCPNCQKWRENKFGLCRECEREMQEMERSMRSDY